MFRATFFCYCSNNTWAPTLTLRQQQGNSRNNLTKEPTSYTCPIIEIEVGQVGGTKRSKAKADGEKCELEVGARCATISRGLKVIKHTNKIKNPIQKRAER